MDAQELEKSYYQQVYGTDDDRLLFTIKTENKYALYFMPSILKLEEYEIWLTDGEGPITNFSIVQQSEDIFYFLAKTNKSIEIIKYDAHNHSTTTNVVTQVPDGFFDMYLTYPGSGVSANIDADE
jgi:hypothetical protein